MLLETRHWALCWRPAPHLAAASSWDVSRGLQPILVSRDLQQHVACSRAGSLSNSSSSQEASGVQSSGQPRALGGSAARPACASPSSRSPPPAPGMPENSHGPREGCEIQERQPVCRDDTHVYAPQYIQYQTETLKVSKDKLSGPVGTGCES